MKKFTIFTVILTVVVIVMMAELAANEYLSQEAKESEEVSSGFRLPEGVNSSDALTANVLGVDSLNEEIESSQEFPEAVSRSEFPDAFEEVNTIIPDLIGEEIEVESVNRLEGSNVLGNELLPVPDASSGNSSSSSSKNKSENKIADFEDFEYSTSQISVFLRDEQVKSAGFANAYLEEQEHQGYLFKTIYVDDFYDTNMQKIAIRNDSSYLAKVYVFDVGINSDVNETYQLIKLRASSSSDKDVNETNQFGDGSFYVNDDRRAQTAFLTVRIGKYIYGFSYPKEYHAQVKNLIQLITWEMN